MRYSPKNNTFYPEVIDYPTLPDDIVTVPNDEAVKAQNAPGGSVITYSNGHLTITPPGDK